MNDDVVVEAGIELLSWYGEAAIYIVSDELTAIDAD